jgi:cyclic pyranopterin phosphate synthase
MEFSHLDRKGKPVMVDVREKKVSKRTAVACSVVEVPKEVLARFEDGDIQTKKGAVFQTAILAGIMASKKTGELIPLCHPLGLDSCNLTIRLNGKGYVDIECTVKTEAKTGVEMEALVGASIAALTIYDMCKAFGHGMKIRETKLLEKTGGKNDFKRK